MNATERTTERGFQLIAFDDSCGVQCSIQQSAQFLDIEPGTSVLLIGPNENRMHIARADIPWLIGVLQRWYDTG